MPKFKVRSKAFALVEQIVEVEAEDAKAAEEMVWDSECDAYHGNNIWKYLGVQDDSTVIEVTPV